MSTLDYETLERIAGVILCLDILSIFHLSQRVFLESSVFNSIASLSKVT